jgi:predicted  nucleic acid-binding Zn-ribbon protein
MKHKKRLKATHAKAQKEVRRLLKEVQAYSRDARKLESGLKKVHKHLETLADFDHSPPFRN